MIRIMSKFRDEIREELGEIQDAIEKLGVERELRGNKELEVPELEKEEGEIIVGTEKGKEKEKKRKKFHYMLLHLLV